MSLYSYNSDMLCLFQVSQHQIYCVFFSQHCTKAVVPSTRLLLGQFPVFKFHLFYVRTVFYQHISRLRFSSQELVCTSAHPIDCTVRSAPKRCPVLLHVICYFAICIECTYSEPKCSFSSVSTNCTAKNWLFYLVEN